MLGNSCDVQSWPLGGSRKLVSFEERAWGIAPSDGGLCTSGLTRFDLLGDFGRFNWLGNFYIVFLYNAAFAGLTTLCLVKTFTAAVRAELIRAFGKGIWSPGWLLGSSFCSRGGPSREEVVLRVYRSPIVHPAPPHCLPLFSFSFPGLDRLPLPVSGFPRASRKKQHQ
jgi:hypothetical protein